MHSRRAAPDTRITSTCCGEQRPVQRSSEASAPTRCRKAGRGRNDSRIHPKVGTSARPPAFDSTPRRNGHIAPTAAKHIARVDGDARYQLAWAILDNSLTVREVRTIVSDINDGTAPERALRTHGVTLGEVTLLAATRTVPRTPAGSLTRGRRTGTSRRSCARKRVRLSEERPSGFRQHGSCGLHVRPVNRLVREVCLFDGPRAEDDGWNSRGDVMA